MKKCIVELTEDEAIYLRQLVDAEDSFEDESRHMADAHYPDSEELRADVLRKLLKVAP